MSLGFAFSRLGAPSTRTFVGQTLVGPWNTHFGWGKVGPGVSGTRSGIVQIRARNRPGKAAPQAEAAHWLGVEMLPQARARRRGGTSCSPPWELPSLPRSAGRRSDVAAAHGASNLASNASASTFRACFEHSFQVLWDVRRTAPEARPTLPAVFGASTLCCRRTSGADLRWGSVHRHHRAPDVRVHLTGDYLGARVSGPSAQIAKLHLSVTYCLALGGGPPQSWQCVCVSAPRYVELSERRLALGPRSHLRRCPSRPAALRGTHALRGGTLWGPCKTRRFPQCTHFREICSRAHQHFDPRRFAFRTRETTSPPNRPISGQSWPVPGRFWSNSREALASIVRSQKHFGFQSW